MFQRRFRRMRLSAIKLAGFKSFVDPTHFRAPTNLTGIVGPNGCGKSNIIDAVRWVMGEGSAKVLRGESMADVIFSGSSTRKPVGTASVELLFDNSEGRVGGQFAGYNEISVKRQVSRDGVSLYFLNNTRCRRKDVRDLFLGTGLGSRSYSIIEQGMISEVVEARPEEIRGHLEEAAGISKYKERRRETERRIQHTRDNLARLSDLREEVGKHLNRLKRQASAANRYRKLKQERRELESRLMTLRWKTLMDTAEAGQRDLAQRETALQESIAGQRAAEAALEELHVEQGRAGEAFNGVQGELYQVGSEIARLEQSIQHARELQERQKTEFRETEEALQDLEKHMVLDRAQVEDLTLALAEVGRVKRRTALSRASPRPTTQWPNGRKLLSTTTRPAPKATGMQTAYVRKSKFWTSDCCSPPAGSKPWSARPARSTRAACAKSWGNWRRSPGSWAAVRPARRKNWIG
jgi:chromosome segregation protein